MADPELKSKVAETREVGCFEFELPEEGFPLDKLLLFAADMFPGVAHEEIYILPTDEGKICVATEKTTRAN